MFDVRIPHVHAPHEDAHGWRGFLTHIAVVAIGLLLALGLEQGVEYVHHEIQRATLEDQMRETFRSNIRRAENDIRTLDSYRAYLFDLKNAAGSRLAGGLLPPPKLSDPRNNAYAPPLNLGAYQAAKTNGSVALLSLNRIRLYDRIELQHDIMLRTFHHFYDSIGELEVFDDRFTSADNSARTPDMARMSAAQLAEYQAVLAKLIAWDRMYARQMRNLTASYQVMLRGTDDLDELTNVIGTRPH